MKNNMRIFLTISALLLAVFVCGFAVFADDTAREGSDLPVSESYVLRLLTALEEKLTQKIDTINANLEEKMDALSAADTETPDTAALEPAVSVSAAYTAERLTKGQVIVGNCELILRSGTAQTVCPGANGISDLTDGVDIPGDTSVIANHLLLVPRDDGRGLLVTSDEAYIMARGTYTIKNAAE